MKVCRVGRMVFSNSEYSKIIELELHSNPLMEKNKKEETNQDQTKTTLFSGKYYSQHYL